MIGYNKEQIETLIQDINRSYTSIGNCMAEGWPNLSATMEAEWVGPDEVSYETELAKNICELYVKCDEVVVGMMTNISKLGENWINFQKNNIMTDADAVTNFFDGISIATSDVVVDLPSTVKAGSPTFSASTNMGLTNGTESGTKIKTVFDAYIDSVYDKVKELYNAFDSSKAFLGSELNSKVNEYLAQMGEALAKLTSCHKSIYDALDQLIARYATHESEEATNVSGAAGDGINFNGQNLK